MPGLNAKSGGSWNAMNNGISFCIFLSRTHQCYLITGCLTYSTYEDENTVAESKSETRTRYDSTQERKFMHSKSVLALF